MRPGRRKSSMKEDGVHENFWTVPEMPWKRKKKENNMKHRFEIKFEGTAIIELDDEIISVVDDEWRSQLYDLHTPVDIAEHIAYNLVINQVGLSNLDGWADQENSNAKIISPPDWEVNGYEIKDD